MERFLNKIKSISKENAFLFGVLGVTLCLIVGLAVGIAVSQDGREKIDTWERAIDLLEKYPLVDGHNDYIWQVRKNFMNQFDQFDFEDMNPYRQFMGASSGISHTDVKRIRQGHLGAQFWAIYTSCDSNYKDAFRIHMEQVDAVKRLVAKYPNELELATSSNDIMKAFKNNKVASLMGLESGHAIDSSLAALRNFYRVGIRYMTLTHNCDTPWATNNLVDRQPNPEIFGGLTDFGKKVIAEMNRIGMMVDLSHTSYRTMLDVLEVSKAPVIFSHSSVFDICNHTRNVRKDVLEKLKQNNGTIMINFYSQFINCGSDWRKTNISDVIAHINYVKDTIGVDYVGIGSDFDGVGNTPLKLDDVSRYPNLVAGLIDNGWNEREIVKLVYGNIYRVFSAVEKFAEEQAKEDVQPFDDFLPLYTEKECYTKFA